MNYSNLLKEIDALKEKNNKIYKQNYIMFIPLSYKTIKENEYEEKMVQYDIENVIEELCYKEKKTIYFINKFLEVFKQIIILDRKLFSKKNISFSPNQYYQELTYYFDSIVASFSTIIESEQRIVLEEYFGQKEINDIFPTRNKFGLYWQIYMLRNRILHFTGKRYSYDNIYCSCYQDFSSKIKIIRIDEKGNINIPSTLLDIYKDENIKRAIDIAIKNKRLNPFELLFPNKSVKGYSKKKPFILHISNDIFFDYSTSAIILLNEIENVFDKINNLFLKKLKEYYDDQDILKKSKTSISVNDIEETYSVEDVFEV